MSGKWQLKDHEAERQLFLRRLTIAAAIVMLLFAALIAKLVNLQIYRLVRSGSDDQSLIIQVALRIAGSLPDATYGIGGPGGDCVGVGGAFRR